MYIFYMKDHLKHSKYKTPHYGSILCYLTLFNCQVLNACRIRGTIPDIKKNKSSGFLSIYKDYPVCYFNGKGTKITTVD